MSSAHPPHQNQLLAALPPAQYERLAADLKLVPLRLGEVLHESGAPLRHGYFPTTAIVSLHYVTASGASLEIAGVGYEGVVGIPLFLGGDSTTSAAVVRTAGHAYRLERRLLKQEFDRAGALRDLLLRYTQGLMTQIFQIAACNRHHSVEQQLSRLLLATLDRMPGSDLVLTQELVASLLGVRREGITEAAGRLQQAGLLSYRRGHIAVLARAGLEARSCECYAAVRKEFGRLLC